MTRDTVPQWGIFERSIEHPIGFPDPYRGTTLLTEFTSPNGVTIPFWGFYDEGEHGKTWRFRFMPDTPGEWAYRAWFTEDNRGGGSAGLHKKEGELLRQQDGSSRITEGRFTCTPSDLPGPVCRYAENPIWFAFRGGSVGGTGRRTGQLRSIHVGDRFFASNFPPEKRNAFLDWAGTQGYTMLSAASHLVNRQTPGRGEGWDTPALWPLRAAEYRRLEALLDDLADRRMVVYQFAGLFGREGFNPTALRDQHLYIRYIMARLGPYWNLLFNVAGPEPVLRGNPFMPKSEVDRLGHLIQRYNTFDHLLSVHNATGADAYFDEDYTTYVTLQGPKTRNRMELRDVILRNHRPDRPLLAQETLWPGNTVGHPPYSDDDIRKNACVLLMSAAAINFGDFDGNSSSGFSGSLDLKDQVQHRHDIIKMVWDLFEEFPYHAMRPRPDLCVGGLLLCDSAGRYLVYVTGDEDDSVLDEPALAESHRDRVGGVRILLSPGEYKGEWIDPENPSDRRGVDVQAQDGAAVHIPLAQDGDRFLFLERRGE